MRAYYKRRKEIQKENEICHKYKANMDLKPTNLENGGITTNSFNKVEIEKEPIAYKISYQRGRLQNNHKQNGNFNSKIINRDVIYIENNAPKINNCIKKEKIIENGNNLIKQKDEDFYANTYDGFNMGKAKLLVNDLLNKDIKYYRNLLPDVNSLSPEEFKHLFEGDSDFPFSSKNQIHLKRLSLKFHNFYFILIDWYEEEKYYPYLLELWPKYPNILEFSSLSREEIESRLNQGITNFPYWPNYIKESLINNIYQPNDLASQVKDEIENEYNDINNLMIEITKLKDALKVDQYLKDYQAIKDMNKYKFDKTNLEEILNNIKKGETIKNGDLLYKNSFLGIQLCKSSLLTIISSLMEKKSKKKIPKKHCEKVTDKILLDYENQDKKNYLDEIKNEKIKIKKKNKKKKKEIKSQEKDDEKNNDDMNKINTCADLVFNILNTFWLIFRLKTTCDLCNNFDLKAKEEKEKRKNITKNIELHSQVLNELSEVDPIKNIQILKKGIAFLRKDEKALLEFLEELRTKIHRAKNNKLSSLSDLFSQTLYLLWNLFSITSAIGIVRILIFANCCVSVVNVGICGIDIYNQGDLIDKLLKEYYDSIEDLRGLEKTIKKFEEKAEEIRSLYANNFLESNQKLIIK